MPMTREDWEGSTGKPCKICGRLSLYLPSGMCTGCWGRTQVDQAEKQGEKTERRYFKRLVSSGKITIAELRDGRVPGELKHEERSFKDVGQED